MSRQSTSVTLQVIAISVILAIGLLLLAETRKADAEDGAVGTVLLGGRATWYETPGFTAAAGPVLRETLGDWRGRYVTVESGGIEVTVQLTDFCACGERGGIPTLLDLSNKAFSGLTGLDDPKTKDVDEGLWPGVIDVSIELDGSTRPHKDDDRMRDEVRDLPATDMEDAE